MATTTTKTPPRFEHGPACALCGVEVLLDRVVWLELANGAIVPTHPACVIALEAPPAATGRGNIGSERY